MTATNACFPVFPLALNRSYNALQAAFVFMAFMHTCTNISQVFAAAFVYFRPTFDACSAAILLD